MYSYIASRFNNFNLDKVEETKDQITFYMSSNVFTATCTKCGTESTNIHQEFTKIIFDVSYQGKKVHLVINQRKFKCKNPYCSQKHFTEELSFVDGKRPYSGYLIDKIMKNKDKTVRTISQIIEEQDKINISKTTVGQIINEHKDDIKYLDIKVVKLDKVQLEINIDEKIDCIDEVVYSSADYIIDEVDDKYSLIDNIKSSFRGISDYPSTYPYQLFITAGLTSRIKRLVASSSMPFALTLKSSINKIGYNILKQRADGTYFSNGAFRDYILNTKEEKLQEGFRTLNNNILKSNGITPTVHIIDATKIDVNMFNPNYENASCISDEGGKKTKGYKLSAMYGLYDDTLVHESSQIDTIKTHDLTAGKVLVSNYPSLKANDIILIDRGYTSFDWFYDLKEKGIYIVTPARKDSDILKNALSLAGVKILDNIRGNSKKIIRENEPAEKTNVIWLQHPNPKRKEQEYRTIKNITMYENINSRSRSLEVNAVVIRFKKQTKEMETTDTYNHYYEDDNYRYAVIYTTDLSKQGKEIITLYEKRMKIEEQFKQLKSNWDLCKLTSTKYKFIIFQLLTTITALGIVQLFTTLESGRKFKNCSLQTIIKQLDVQGKYNKTDLIVSSKDVFASYKLSEAFEMIVNKNKDIQLDFIKHLKKSEESGY
ncbi:MAG: transposase [Bacilli bacterium]|nr:transposase [Bacilli bacterium]